MIMHTEEQSTNPLSFILEGAVTHETYSAAKRVVRNLVNLPLNSDHGLMVTYDRPVGCPRNITNFQRPAVLRQHFGRVDYKRDHIYCYGTGSGSASVGTHPAYIITREMTPDMEKVADELFEVVKKYNHNQGMAVEPFNHCTVLFYFNKCPNSSQSMLLGFHTDNVFSSNGKFLLKKNTQKENTPTCILTLGEQRELHLQHQYRCQINNKRWKWCERYRRKVILTDKTVFVLHPNDERPKLLGKHLRRWRHGVPAFKDNDTVSIALVYRTVMSSTNLVEVPTNSERDKMIFKSDLSRCHCIHKRLRSMISKILPPDHTHEEKIHQHGTAHNFPVPLLRTYLPT